MAKNISTKKMRVLHVAKWYPNRYDVQNGVFIEKHIACTAAFADVKVLAWLQGEDRTEIVESIEKNLPITRHYFKRKTTISYKRSAFREYIRSHYNNNNLPDIVHLHIFSPDLLLVANWAKKRKIPVVISEHWSGYMRGIFERLPYWRKWAYRKLAKGNIILPVSLFLQENMQRNGLDGDYKIVPNVVKQNQNQVQKLPVFTFLVVADLIDQVKNVSGIIHAFAEVGAKFPESELHIVGGGPDEKKIADLAKNSPVSGHIKLLGRLANEEVLKLMPACHVLINNSRIESFGVVVLEAHAAGIPVISTLCGGPNEWLETGDFPIEVDNQQELQNAMKAAFAAKDQVVFFQKWKACLPEAVGRKLESVYQQLLSDNK